MDETIRKRGLISNSTEIGEQIETTPLLVGRDREMDLLHGHVNRLSDGMGGVVHVTGASGIGKSRLISELTKMEIIGRFPLAEGRALSIGKNLAFHPFASLVKGWAGINEHEEESQAAAKLLEALSLLPIEDFEKMLPFVGAVMGLQVSDLPMSSPRALEGEAQETLIVKYMRDLFAGIASVAPLVVVIEDFQWADRSSINLLASLGQLVPKEPILFIVIYIPEAGDQTDLIRETTDGIDSSSYLNIELGPLDDAESRGVIFNLLGADSFTHDVFRKIIRQACGSPLFLVEAVHLLVDEGAVVKKDGVFSQTEKIETTVIPDTLKELLKSRLSQLNSDTQDLIKTASVMEKSIMSRVLGEISSVPGNVAVPDGGFRRFTSLYRESEIAQNHLLTHTLGQETAYESIPEDQKRGLHLRVADTIERIFYHRLHEFFGVLAYHYGVAGADVKAKNYLIKSGSEALESAAFTEALNCFQEALAIYQRQPAGMRDRDEWIVMTKNIGITLYHLGRYEECLPFLTRVLAHYGQTETINPIIRFMAFLRGFVSFLVSIYLPTLKWQKTPTNSDREFLKLFYIKSSALANVDSIRFFFESFYFARRFVNFNITQIRNGIVMFAGYSAVFAWTGASFTLSRKVLSFVKEKMDANDVRAEMYYEITDMIHNFFTGRWNDNTFKENTLNLNLSQGEVTNSVNYLTLHGQFVIEKGDSPATKKILNDLHEVASVYNNTYAWAYWHTLKIKKLMKNRSFVEVLSTIDEILEYLKKHDLKILLNLLYSTKSLAQVMMGDLSGSTDSLSRAQDYQGAIRSLPYYQLRFLIAALTQELSILERPGEALQKGYQKKAHTQIDRQIRLARRLARQDASARTDLFRLIGTYNWIAGRQRKAQTWWSRAVQEGERLGALPDLARTYEEIGGRLSEPGSCYRNTQGIDSGNYLRKARDIYSFLTSGDEIVTTGKDIEPRTNG